MEPLDPPPPPTPYEREGAGGGGAVGARAIARRRRRRTVAGIASVLLVVAVAVGGWLELRDGGWAQQRSAADERARDVALLALFEDIERSEGAMLGYYDRLRDELTDPTSERDDELAVIGAVAADAVLALREVRARIVALTGDAVVDDVRAAYLPHLDSWVDYLEAVVDAPDLELDRERATPFTLVINATARAFRVATEDMLDTGPSDAVRELAEAILDEGFRGFDDEADT